ncbi:MAG: hypothetical protein ACYC3F_09620 [Gemmatimonadaceae bacterium]
MNPRFRIAVVHVDDDRLNLVCSLIEGCTRLLAVRIKGYSHGCQQGSALLADGLGAADLVFQHCGLPREGQPEGNEEYGDAVRSYLRTRPNGAVVLFSGDSDDVEAARHAFGTDPRVHVASGAWLRTGLCQYLNDLLTRAGALTGSPSDCAPPSSAALEFLSALSVYHLHFAAKPTDGRGALRHAAGEVISSAPASPDFEQAVEIALGNAIVHEHDQSAVASALVDYPETRSLSALLAAHSWTRWADDAGAPPSTLSAAICGLSSCSSFNTWHSYVLSVREALMTGEGSSM